MKGRFASSVIVAAAILVGTAGCGFAAPQATENEYFASDGVGADLGYVSVENALIISEDGEDGNLVFTAVNNGTSSETLNVQWEVGGSKETEKVHLDAGEVLETETLAITGLDTQPGGLFDVYVQAGDSEGVQLQVPVLDGSLPEYATLAPSAEG